MAELRQRRGDPQGSQDTDLPTDEAQVSKEELIQQLENMLLRIKEGPRPGLSHAAKGWKDQLREDPYNLQLIFELGIAYAQDQQWEQCTNVMLRGWKRVDELEDLDLRCHFLMTLCEASMAQRKFRQAMAVLHDIEDPESEETRTRLEALRCNVLCSNGNVSAGLKAFHKGIDGQDFDTASAFWAMCYTGLQSAEAVEVAKSKIESLATDDQMLNRLQLLEHITKIKYNCVNQTEQAKQSRSANLRVLAAMVIVALCLLGCVLYVLEQRNLERLKIRM